MLGAEVTITGYADDPRYYQIDFLHNGLPVDVREDYLRRKPPKADYDGNQAGSWDLIPYWQPNKTREQA